MGATRAIFIDDRVAGGMNLLNIAPPLKCLSISLEFIPQTDLPKVLQNDVTTLDVSV